MRATALFAICLAFAGSLPAAAQTFGEAVRINVALATSLCADAMLNGTSANAIFGNSGFVYRGVDRGVNSYGVTLGRAHYFDAPADTVKTQVANPNGHPGICSVYTPHLPEAELSGIVANLLFRKFPQLESRGTNQWVIRQGTHLPLIVSIRTISSDHRYEAPGTVQVSMSFPG